MSRPRIYAWEKWFAQERFTLRRGRDYHCQQSTMVQNIRNEAVKYGVHVSIHDVGHIIQVIVKEKVDVS